MSQHIKSDKAPDKESPWSLGTVKWEMHEQNKTEHTGTTDADGWAFVGADFAEKARQGQILTDGQGWLKCSALKLSWNTGQPVEIKMILPNDANRQSLGWNNCSFPFQQAGEDAF